MRRVWLVGAGYISDVHAEALRTMPNVRLQGVVDPNLTLAQSLAARWSIAETAASVEEAIASGHVDCAHVLTPPNIHAEVALPFARAAIPVLIEKPLAASRAECEALITHSRANNVIVGVNHNFLFHPAFCRLRKSLAARRFGRPRFMDVIYNVSLRQLASRQFGHWMFHAPGNLLLEQAVHPLSQIVAIAGRVQHVAARAAAAIEISPGVPLYPSLNLILECSELPVVMRFAVGGNFPYWQVSVVCDDGVLVADILSNRFFTYGRSRWMQPLDEFVSGARTASAIFRDSVRYTSDFALSTLRIKPRRDPFFVSMQQSIAAFHQALDEGRSPESNAELGAHLVDICSDAARSTFTVPSAPAPLRTRGEYDIAVLGGTGFIGTHLVRRLVSEGRRVGVMARNTRNLPREFCDDRVVLIRGDIRDAAAVEQAIGDACTVINLAHGGGGKSFAEIRSAMVDSAQTVAQCCLSLGVRRLIHIGSIAGLYLGPQRSAVTGSTPPDAKAEHRSDYARAKAECDRVLLAMSKTDRLPLCILRPGLVVGEGGIVLHGGLGSFNNEQHCIGWNSGRNPLPFVLVEDVAEAIWLACIAPGVDGHAYNIVGDVRLTAREYLFELSQATSRPFQFHPKRPTSLWVGDLAKWGVKRISGRKAPRPALRDVVSRGLMAEFDCSDAKRDLGWKPVSDRTVFIERAIQICATG